mmetsp:Transcript_9661/g.21459  ORF Transcript_9661/g.21459 Transcript_9661/m.21459 type:complete len:347 (-) Transcript_9661:478-1518(-)
MKQRLMIREGVAGSQRFHTFDILLLFLSSFHSVAAQHARSRAHSRSPGPSASRFSHRPLYSSSGDSFDAFENFMDKSSSQREGFSGFSERVRKTLGGDGKYGRDGTAPGRLRPGRFYRPWKIGADVPCGTGDGGLRVRRQQRRFVRKAANARRRVRSMDLRVRASPASKITSVLTSARLSVWEGLSMVSGAASDMFDYGKTTFRCTTATGKITVVNILAFGAQMLSPSVTAAGAKVSRLVLEQGQYHRLVTPIVLHGGLAHLAVNMYSLANLGPLVNRSFGTARFTWTYLAGGVMGNIFSTLLSSSNSVGASGAIFGLVGAYYVFLTRNKVGFSFLNFSHFFMRFL